LPALSEGCGQALRIDSEPGGFDGTETKVNPITKFTLAAGAVLATVSLAACGQPEPTPPPVEAQPFPISPPPVEVVPAPVDATPPTPVAPERATAPRPSTPPAKKAPPPAPELDHSNMPGMDPNMDHSKMPGMEPKK
jgi:hypothetical protein